MQKLLESQPAVKKDRAGELALGNSFLVILGLPGRGIVSRLGVQGRLKNRVGGRGRGEMAGGGGSGPISLHFFRFFWHFLHLYCIVLHVFLHFPD